MLTVSYDEATGVVHTIASGMSDRESVEQYLFELQILVDRARNEWGRYWHLVDASGVELQSLEALSCLAGASIEQLCPDDRTAVAMTSIAAIEQLSTMPSQFMTRVFGDLKTARDQLMGDWD